MSPAKVAEILQRIDDCVGAPESETAAEHEARLAMVARHQAAREIRRASGA